jgi:hypothetical protein
MILDIKRKIIRYKDMRITTDYISEHETFSTTISARDQCISVRVFDRY